MAHLPLKKLLAFHYDQLSAAEKDDVQAHLDACASCEKNLTLLIKPELALKIKPASTGTRVTEQAACLSPETIGKYINHELRPAEIPAAEKHLASCEGCRHQLVAISQISIEPVSEEARQLLEALPPLEISEQVNAIQEIIRKWKKPEITPVKIRLKEKWSLDSFVPQPAFIFIAILLLGIAGKWWAWPAYQYYRFVRQSERQLVEQNKIYYRNEPRPAGDYRSSREYQLMAPQEERQTTGALLTQALRYKPDGEMARLRLAQYFLLQKMDSSADSLLKLLEAASPQNAAVLNDRGIWLLRRQRYDSAAIFFQRAFALNPQLDEALYNLALAQTQQGDTAAAKTNWKKYLVLDAKTEWHNAARAQLQELE